MQSGTVNLLTSVWEEPGVDRVESLLGDQAGRTLGLEASVNALHLGNSEPEKRGQ